MHCSERGELLGRVRRAMRHYLGELVGRVRAMEAGAREVAIRELEAENAELREKLGETKTLATRSKVFGRFQRAVAQERSERYSVGALAESNVPRELSTSSEACLLAYKACSEQEQQGFWRDMVSATPPKDRAPLLQLVFKSFSEPKRAELLRGLHAEMTTELSTPCVQAVADRLPFESRLGIVEGLLRNFSSFETLTLVEFLPYVWGSLAVNYAAKLLALLQPSDRSQLVKVLILEEKAAREAEEASAAVAKLSAAETEAAKRLSLAADPTELLPSELDHWRKFAPSPPPPPPPPKEGTELTSDGAKDAKKGGEPALKELLLLSAECFEVAASYAARKLARRVGGTQYEDAETPDPSFPQIVFNVLLRRNIPPPKPGLQSTQCAREALWTLLTGARQFGKSHPRARLLARLCGVVKHPFHARRVGLCMRVLVELLGAEPIFEDEMWLPMARREDARGDEARDLPKLIRERLEVELGGSTRVTALLQRLEREIVETPKERQLLAARHKDAPFAIPTQIIHADTALLLLCDAFDAARMAHAARLATLHEHLEVTRVSGGLDAHTFATLLQSYDPTLDQRRALDILVECELGREEGDGRGGPFQGIPRHVFVRVCDAHDVRKGGKADV